MDLNFYPRPPRGGRPLPSTTPASSKNFYPRPPRGGRLFYILCGASLFNISIHALREEGDRLQAVCVPCLSNFYPRPPRGGRPRNGDAPRSDSFISIHALREEGDLAIGVGLFYRKHFYPRPPRGGRLICHSTVATNLEFLSTPSARRATGCYRRRRCVHPISIHALREEGDCFVSGFAGLQGGFLSTPSARRATPLFKRVSHGLRFLSTPSARRATVALRCSHLLCKDFYPRPPRGGRRLCGCRGSL